MITASTSDMPRSLHPTLRPHLNRLFLTEQLGVLGRCSSVLTSAGPAYASSLVDLGFLNR